MSSDEEQENPVQTAASPSKKKKDSKPIQRRRDETPIRGALAKKLAQTEIKDDENIEDPEKGIVFIVVLSTRTWRKKS